MTAPNDAARSGPARLDRVGFHALVEQLAKARKIEDGCVTVIGLDAIRDRLGARWPRRCTQVWEAVDRLLERRLPPHALHARIDDVSYLIEAGTSPESAQSTSFKLLQELHLFFLGEPKFEAMKVASVLSFDGGRLLTQPVVGRSFDPPDDVPPVRPPPPATPDPAAIQWSALSFVTASHRVQVAYERQAVILLSTGKPTAVRLKPVVRVDGAERSGAAISEGLTHAELMALDQATMLEAMSAGEGAIVAPFFFETLSTTRGRAAILKTLAGQPPPRGLITELIGIDRGTPESRLLETVSLIAPYCAAIIVQAPADRPCVSLTRATRLKGMSIDCEDVHPQRGPAARLMECKTRSGIGPLLFAFGLASPGLLPLARAAGATHASLARRPAP